MCVVPGALRPSRLIIAITLDIGYNYNTKIYDKAGRQVLKVLICDDEYGICKLIQNLTDWEQLGMECIGTAKNGKEGLQMIHTLKPDVVITDINMPKITGLDMIKTVFEEGLDISFVSVSGYSEFDYAFTAIKYGVSAYLLKPINREELNDALASVAGKILEKRGIEKKQKANESDIQVLREKIRKTFIHRLCTDESLNLAELDDDSLAEFSFCSDSGIYQVLKVSYDSEDYSVSNISTILESTSKRILRGFMEECHEAEFALYDKNACFLINYSIEKQKTINSLCKYLLDITKNSLIGSDIVPTFGLGRPVTFVRDLQQSALDASKAVMSRLIKGCGVLIVFTDCDQNVQAVNPDEEDIENCLDLRNPVLTVRQLEGYIRRNGESFEKAAYLFLPFINDWFKIFRNVLGKHYDFGEDEKVILEQAYRQINIASSADAVLATIKSCVESIYDSLLKKSSISDVKVINMAKEYVQTHYAEPIELKDVADTVFLSPSYFGILFKKKTGVNFSDYVTEVRLEMAKKLLRGVEYNVCEIAEKVGYKDTSYFSKLFKKRYGVKPLEYRKVSHQLNI